MNDGLHSEIAEMKIRINQLEQCTKKNCCIVISGVKEIFAEQLKMVPLQMIYRWQHAKTQLARFALLFLKYANNHLKIKKPGPRPILANFHATSHRAKVIKLRRPNQKFIYKASLLQQRSSSN